MLIPGKFRPALKTAYLKARYWGFRYRCPLCKSRLRTFLPYGLDLPVLKEKRVVGGGYRLSSLCPCCGSLDRERLLYLYLLHKTDIFRNPLKVLHVAPEERVQRVLSRSPNLDYVTADIASPHVMARMDLTDIPFHESVFDAVICNHVLEFIPDDRKAMAELFRILKPGGWAILQVPISLALEKTSEDSSIATARGREEAFGDGGHVRIYAKDYEVRLVHAGFRVDAFRWLSDPGKFGGRENRFGLIEQECVYLARKP